MPIEALIECWNCGKTYEIEFYENCPRCGENKNDDPTLGHMIQIDPPNEAYLFDLPDMSPIYYPECGNDVKQANIALRKYRELNDTGKFPELFLVRSYVKEHRGWVIEFKHRNLLMNEYLLAPLGLKLSKIGFTKVNV